MLNLVDDEPQPLANGHAPGAAAESNAAAGVPDPVAELMGLHIGGQPPASSSTQAQPSQGASQT